MSHVCLLPTTHSLPHDQHPPPRDQHPPGGGTFVTIDEPGLTHHNHLEATVYIRVHLGVAHSVGFEQCIVMTCAHHYHIIWSCFIALKTLNSACSPLPSHPQLSVYYLYMAES